MSEITIGSKVKIISVPHPAAPHLNEVGEVVDVAEDNAAYLVYMPHLSEIDPEGVAQYNAIAPLLGIGADEYTFYPEEVELAS